MPTNANTSAGDPLRPTYFPPIPLWRNAALPLGIRAVAWSLAEQRAGVQDDAPGSHTSPRIRQYLAPCVRHDRPLGLVAGNWCAASACAAMWASLLPGEKQPHPYRAGGLEIQQDAIWANRGGDIHWASARLVMEGEATVQVGDLAVFQRGNPAIPQQLWMRHVARITDDPDATGRYETIGGNEGGIWRRTERRLLDPDLLGFVRYPQETYSLPRAA